MTGDAGRLCCTGPMDLPPARWRVLNCKMGPPTEAAYLATSQTAPAPTAVMATDIASAVAMSLTHSQIVNEQFQSAPLRHCTVHEPETAARSGGA
jgi:hypothetical protein